MKSLFIVAAVALKIAWANPTCTGKWEDVSAGEFIANLNPGWNLGNTLDAVPTEGSWNNPPVDLATFQTIKHSGFKSVRLPITWADHFITGAPDYQVNATWLERVSKVVDMSLSLGLWTIVNVHHDATMWADYSQAGANVTAIEEQFYQLWVQIATTLGCKSSKVAFEPINEPVCNNANDADEINKLNVIFLQAINDVGGWNSKRVVTLVGGNELIPMTTEWFVVPTGFPNPIALQVHYYSPYDFIFGAWGKTYWGAQIDEDTVDSDFGSMRGNFTDYPILIGEFDASPQNTEPAGRWKWTDFLVRTARKYNFSYILWDNGADNLNRATGVWRDLTSISMIVENPMRVNHSLPDSTEDESATSQWSSAYIFHQKGTPVVDQSLPFIFNGNRLVCISESSSKTLREGVDYVVEGSNITFHSSYLSRQYSPDTAPGVLKNLTLTFSQGTKPVIQIVQWDKPTLASTSAVASDVAGNDLHIPVTWAGLPRIATVQATMSNGVYLKDSWTQYLGHLQQGRATYGNDFNWDDGDVIITSSAINSVISQGFTTNFTFEFFPRDGGVYNAVNFTLTV